MNSSFLHATIDGEIATLSVQRPASDNALNGAVVCQLGEAFRQAAADRAVGGIVIGRAEQPFVSGADVPFFIRNIKSGDIDRIVAFTRMAQDLLGEMDRCAKPVVACIHGAALGAGLEMALACDRIVVSTRTTLGLPETRLAIYPGLGGTQRLPRRIGIGLAKWLIFTGARIPATVAAQIGLVDQVVEPDRLDHAARDVAMSLADARDSGGPAAVDLRPEHVALRDFFASHSGEAIQQGRADTGGDKQLTMAACQVAAAGSIAIRIADWLIDTGMALPLEDALQLEIDHLIDVFTTEDALAGLQSVVTKGRAPTFRGR